MSMELKSVFQSLAQSPFMGRLPYFASALMLVMLIFAVAEITWELIPEPEFEKVTTVTSLNKGSAKAKSGQVKQSLSRLHLFGESKQTSQVVKRQTTKAPITRLNLTLRGVIASGKSSLAKAIIADSSGRENFYGLGAKIPGGAILEEIHATHVIIKRNDRLETLQLPKEVPKGARSRVTKRNNKRAVKRSASLPTNYNKETGTLLREFRDVLKTDPQKLMDLVRARPYRENGKLVGYKIRPGKDRKLMGKFGFKSGDVVTSVNGISLDNPINGLEIIKNLTTANAVAVDIKRGGVPQSLSFAVD